MLLSSAVYAQNVTPINHATLDNSIIENSGLINIDGTLWTHNDSGGAAKLYAVNPTNGTVIRDVTIQNATNIDWEDITFSPKYVYIGDFGNNSGNRQNLKVYRISRKALQSGAASVESKIIHFSYDDQVTFPDRDFDCEAMVWFRDTLYLFSKNWDDKKTRFYTLSQTPGNHTAHYQATFNIGALVTAATIHPYTKVLTLSVYSDSLEPSNWLFYAYEDDDFFSASSLKLLWVSPTTSQIESASYADIYSVYVSSEEYVYTIWGVPLVFPAKLYEVDFSTYVPTYDDFEGALELVHQEGVVVDDVETTTLDMSADKSAGSCWSDSLAQNVWFKFQATSNTVSLSVRNGTLWGNSTQLSMALWKSDGTTELSCASYNAPEDDIYIHTEVLRTGEWYYLSIDSQTQGSFTLFMDNHSLNPDTIEESGLLRLNTDSEKFEYYNGIGWLNMH